MKSKIGLLGVAMLALLLLGGAGCAEKQTNNMPAQGVKTSAENKEPIKIGWVGPLTGDAATVGVAAKQAVEIAVKEVNDKGGINGRSLQVIYEDSACDAKTGSNAGNKLINVEKVPVIVGELCSGSLLSVAPMAEQNKVVMIGAGTTAPAITQAGDYIFRAVPSDSYQGKYAAQFIYNTLGKRKVAVLYAKADYTEGLANVFSEEFKKLGGEVVVSDSFLQTARDLRTQLSKIKNSNADVFYLSTYTEAGIAALKQAMEMGLKTQIIGTEIFDDPKLNSAQGAEGSLYTAPVSLANEEFKTKYLLITGQKELPVYVTQNYDVLNIVVDALKRSGADGTKLKDELYKIKDYQGVSGPIGFDENGDLLTAQYEVKIIKNGRGVKYEKQ